MRTRLLVIDSHPLIYRNLFSKGTKDLKTSQGIFSGAFYGTIKCLKSLKERFPQAYMVCAFDAGSSGRHEIYADYKPMSERGEEVQSSIDNVRYFCQKVGIPTLYREGIEADDLISIAATMWIQRDERYHSMIVSSDTDFFQLVKTNLTMYDDRAKKFYGPEEVFAKTKVKPLHFLAYKCLKGDVADHIPGIPGFGVVKAAQFASVGFSAVPAEYKEDYKRNRRLMELPKEFKQMSRILTESQQREYRRAIENIFRGWENDEGRHLRLDEAKEVFAYYEINSLKVEDFL